MKKFIMTGCLVASLIFVSSHVNAQKWADVQKPDNSENPWSIEMSLSGTNHTGIDWKQPALRGRYFLNDDWAVRLQLGLGDGNGTALSESYRYADPTPNSDKEGTQDINRAAWNVQIGGEYHFLGTQKLDPYTYLGINIGGASQKEEGVDFDGSSFAEDVSYEASGSYFVAGAELGLGMDFYFVQNVYLGLEVGLGFSNYSYADSETIQNTPLGETISTSPGHKENYIGAKAGLRLGWRF